MISSLDLDHFGNTHEAIDGHVNMYPRRHLGRNSCHKVIEFAEKVVDGHEIFSDTQRKKYGKKQDQNNAVQNSQNLEGKIRQISAKK